jgi:hypothetical protein
MIARSDRVRRSAFLLEHTGSTAPTMLPRMASFGAAKAEPPVFNMPGGFAVNAHEIGKVIYPNKSRRVRRV